MSVKKSREQFVKLAVIAVSGGLVATLALPAYAFNQTDVDAKSIAQAPKEVVVQTLGRSERLSPDPPVPGVASGTVRMAWQGMLARAGWGPC